MNKQDIKNIKKRYLLWLYKTAKESLDKIERKFTQSEIDRLILKELEKQDKYNKVKKFIGEFRIYIQNKEKDGLSLKYENKDLNPDYLFLVLKLKAIEKTIISELGRVGLKQIKSHYEQEMTERILRSAENR